MSRDRVTLTRADSIRQRHEEEQKRREALTQKRVTHPKPVSRPKAERTPRKPAPASRHSRRYDIAMSAPYGRGRFESRAGERQIRVPKIGYGPRWLSFLLVAACVMSLYIILGMDPFIVRGAEISGNQRLGADQISSVLGVMGQSSVLLNPAQMEYNILSAFPDIAAAQVTVIPPARVVITVKERQPVAAWQQDGQVSWVDAHGYAFPPRGEIKGLVTVTANGVPPAPANLNITQKIGARPFLTTEMTAALAALSKKVPQDAALIYDPQYGLGWNDSRGWRVFFGNSNGDMSTKFLVYQALVDHLAAESIQPTLISVEFPNAPFYRVDQ